MRKIKLSGVKNRSPLNLVVLNLLKVYATDWRDGSRETEDRSRESGV